jgi:hypothetical protein
MQRDAPPDLLFGKCPDVLKGEWTGARGGRFPRDFAVKK